MKTAEEELYRNIWDEKIRREKDLSVDGDQRSSSAIELIEKGNRLLDIGCGEGTLASKALEKYREVYGIDISEDAVRLAKASGVVASCINLNVEPLPYPDNYFDTVTSLDVIEHIFDPANFVKEIYRVLTPGGNVIISTPNIRKIERIITLIKGRFPGTSFDPVGFDGGHIHYFTSHDLSDLMVRNNFRVLRIDGIRGNRLTWKYRLVVGLFGKQFEKEFLSVAILLKAEKI